MGLVACPNSQRETAIKVDLNARSGFLPLKGIPGGGGVGVRANTFRRRGPLNPGENVR